MEIGLNLVVYLRYMHGTKFSILLRLAMKLLDRRSVDLFGSISCIVKLCAS